MTWENVYVSIVRDNKYFFYGLHTFIRSTGNIYQTALENTAALLNRVPRRWHSSYHDAIVPVHSNLPLPVFSHQVSVVERRIFKCVWKHVVFFLKLIFFWYNFILLVLCSSLCASLRFGPSDYVSQIIHS